MANTPEHTQLLKLLVIQERNLSLIYSNLAKELAVILRKYKYRSNPKIWFRNTQIKKKIEKILQKYRKIIFENLKDAQDAAWNLSENHNDKLTSDYLKGINILDKDNNKLFLRTTAALTAFRKRIESGLSLSQRVWKITSQTQGQIETFLAEGLTEGRSAVELARDLKRYLKEPQKRFRRIRNPKTGKLMISDPAKNYHPGRGVYRSSYKNALRLTRNEINIAYRTADHERRKKLPFVMGIKVNLSNAHPRYDICDELQGEYPKEFVFTGWHVNCLCFTTTKLLPKKDFIKYLNTGNLPQFRKVRTIPKRANNYLNKNEDKLNALKSKPNFLGNFKKTDKGFVLSM